MTEYIDVNHLAWRHGTPTQISTQGLVAPAVQTLDVHANERAVDPTTILALAEMNMPGIVVGFIVEVITNDHANDQEIVMMKGTGTVASPSLSDFPLKVTVPANETNIYYSPTNTAEFNREFDLGDWIGLQFRKPNGAQATGMQIGAVMIGVELETPGS